MGVCTSSTAEADVAKKRSKAVEKALQPDTAVAQKLLLLGAGESGKSTILKQMIILHKNGFTSAEREERKTVIYGNVIVCITTLIKAMKALDIPLADPQVQTQLRLVSALAEAGKETEPLTAEVVDAVKRLWADAGVQECYRRRSEYQLNDSAKYFIESVERIARPDFSPTDDDMLQTRVATTGVQEVNFNCKTILFRVFDVGGQRSERRKWIHYFDDVNVIIFVAAISEYDQRLREDEKTNRLTETLALFEQIANNDFFYKTSLILFLNKRDLFQEKLPISPLSNIFPTFTGGADYKLAIDFLATAFLSQIADTNKQQYVHETCATDTNQVQAIIESVLDTIVASSMKKAVRI